MVDIPKLNDAQLSLLVLLGGIHGPQTDVAWNTWAKACQGPKQISNTKFQVLCALLARAGDAYVFQSSQQTFYTLPPDVLMQVFERAQQRGLLHALNRAMNAQRSREDNEDAGGIDGEQESRSRSYRWLSGSLCDLRVFLIESDRAGVTKTVHRLSSIVSATAGDLGTLLVSILGVSVRLGWIESLPESTQSIYLSTLLERCSSRFSARHPLLMGFVANHGDRKDKMTLARLLTLRGELESVTRIGKLPKFGLESLRVLDAFSRGQYEEAAALGDRVVLGTKQPKHRQLHDLEGAIHALVRVVTMHKNPRRMAAFADGLVSARRTPGAYKNFYRILASFHKASQSIQQQESIFADIDRPRGSDSSWEDLLVYCLCIHWLGGSLKKYAEFARDRLIAERDDAIAGGVTCIAHELSALLALMDGKEAPTNSLAAGFRRREPWETLLDVFSASAGRITQNSNTGTGPSQFRPHLVWEVVVYDGRAQISARMISSPKARKGKPVAISTLKDGTPDSLSDQDLRVLAHVEDVVSGDGYRPRSRQELGDRALVALIGHPRVRGADGESLQITRGQPQLRSRQEAGDTLLELIPPQLALQDVAIVATPRKLEVYEREDRLKPIFASFREAENGELRIPASGRERLLETLSTLSISGGLRVEGEKALSARDVEARFQTVFQLQWEGSTFSVRARVLPLGEGGPEFPPGEGPTKISARMNDELISCARDLTREMAHFRGLMKDCPGLDSQGDDHWTWRLSDLDQSLEILMELNALGVRATLAWPEGKKLSISGIANARAMKISVSSQRDWLKINVKLASDELQVLSFKEILSQRRGKGKFIELGNNQFLALTNDLRQRIDVLENLSEETGKSRHAPALLLPRLQQLVGEDAELHLDKSARSRLESMQKIAQSSPRVPRSLRATLRDYQVAGYRWISRLAEAGLGAVLADDMGLGKTLQALALICQRSRRGPALVVAPTSVVGNWKSETKKFCPGLRCHDLAETSERTALISELKAGDLLLCSYGLFVSESEALTAMPFSTLVYDEAHALKNPHTKRTRVAFSMQSDFRLSLTGTPIENHLGELWSVFQVTIPGLLGREKKFESRFSAPISQGNRERARQLRDLVRPFILRRTRSQVLYDLPPITESTILVRPSKEERAFYEALRRDAVEQTRKSAKAGGKSRLKILAEITRLRMAAVDPRLIDQDRAPEGAKIKALVTRLTALRQEGHRVLVFSQFLRSMEYVRARLDTEGIKHLGFDGSTPAHRRKQAVDAFQSGEGDVFLMSLKAGGIGINLTGADYVIHLDPWWNPAVEDQATARAHRIGQRRAVTVYRLVTEGTIEEKILDLHTSKRDLADDLLSGLESAKRLKLDDLRALLKTVDE